MIKTINLIDNKEFSNFNPKSEVEFFTEVIRYYYNIPKDDRFRVDETIINNSVVLATINENLRIKDNDAGIDISNIEDFEMKEGIKHYLFNPFLIKTGTKIRLPIGYACLVLPRSSSALKHGYTIGNSPGLIDASYRGDIGLIINIFNVNKFKDICKVKNGKLDIPIYYIPKGSRLGQLLIVPSLYFSRYYIPSEIYFIIIKNEYIYENFDKIFPSDRGSKGFGSTGIRS